MQNILTAILAIALLPSQATLMTFTSDRVFLTRNSRFRPLLTRSLDGLIYASFPASPHPRIKLETERLHDDPCEIDFPAMNDIEYPLSLDSLANGKLVLSFMGSENLLYRYLLTLIVDPTRCNVENVTTGLNETGEYPRDSVVVLTGEDVFDVFFETHPHCREDTGCRLRYSEDGQLIGVTEFEVPEDAESWSIGSVVERNFTDGYFYSVTGRNYTRVQWVEQDLKVLNELTIAKPFLYSASHGAANDCRGVTASDLECELRDREFATRGRLVIDAEYFKRYMRAARLFNLSTGAAMIFYVLQVYDESDRYSTFLQYVDPRGHADNPVKFQEDVCKDFKDIGMTLMRRDFYCFSVYCRDGIFTKCADVGQK